MNDDFPISAPPVVFPGQSAPESAYRTAFDLLARRAPQEALGVLEAALVEEPDNTGLRTLRAWAFLMRAQTAPCRGRARPPGRGEPRRRLGATRARPVPGRQSRYAEALPHLRLAAAMSGDPEHGLAALRVERLLTPAG